MIAASFQFFEKMQSLIRSKVAAWLHILDEHTVQQTVNTAIRLLFFLICHIPSSIVLSTTAELFGPSPSEVKANT